MVLHDGKPAKVIVVGSSTTGLSCIRCVTRAGYTAYAACGDDAWPTKTRYNNRLPASTNGTWRGELGDAGYRFLEELPFESAVLMPATDDAALWQSALPEHLCERFAVSSSSSNALSILQDKARFSVLVRDLGVPAPWTQPVDDVADIDAIPFNELDAIFLKPTDSQSFYYEYGEKAFWVNDEADARRILYDAAGKGLSMVAQEYVTGASDAHYFIDGFRDAGGTVAAKMARRRLRIYPRDFGNSSYCESISFAEVEDAWRGLERILEEVSYRGIFSAEFKRDARDGHFKILEINTRPWVYIEFAEYCGMNMCGLYVRDALGEPISLLSKSLEGKGCVNLYHDLAAIREAPPGDRPGWSTVGRQWLLSFKLLFSVSDPVPALVFLRTLAADQIRKLLGRRA